MFGVEDVKTTGISMLKTRIIMDPTENFSIMAKRNPTPVTSPGLMSNILRFSDEETHNRKKMQNQYTAKQPKMS